MKPTAGISNVAGESSARARPSVADELRTVDTSVLDQLVHIRQEEARLEDYRERAEARRGDVSTPVYRRVIEDYAKRGAALEQQASPLRAKARSEYRKLRQLVDHISRAYEQAKLEKEELEFRHAVGELDDDRLVEQLESPQGVLDDCQADMACIDEQKARFIEALGSEAALESPAQSEAHEPATPSAAPARVETPGAPGGAALQPAKDLASQSAAGSTPAAPAGSRAGGSANAPAPVMPPQMSPDDTVLVGADETRMIAPRDAVAPPPQSDDTSEGQTILVPLAALIAESDTLPQKEYRLGAVNYLGRAEDNQVQITSPGVSRKHAVIMAAPRGFDLKDLGSQNGVAVNGARVTERTLADGDRIEIGGVSFVFRSPWPMPRAPKATTGTTARPGAKS